MHGHLNVKKRTNRGSHTLFYLSTEDVGSLAKCGPILLAVLVCCLPHAVVVFIYLFICAVSSPASNERRLVN